MASFRKVFRNDPHLDDPQFFESFSVALRRLDQLGIHFELMSDEASDATQIHQITWLSDDESVEISLVRDNSCDISYISIDTVKTALSKQIAKTLEEDLAFADYAELLKQAREDFIINPPLLLKCALCAKKNDAELISLLSEALDHRLPQVRFFAARAMGRTTWSIFAELLEGALKMENDQDIVSAAEHALNQCTEAAKK